MIYHIVSEADYHARRDGQRYLPSGLAVEASVPAVANDYYGAVGDTLLLLRIDPARLKSPTKYEAAAPAPDAGTSHVTTATVFPHVYGPIDIAAIDGVGILTKGDHGYVWPTEFMSVANHLVGG